MGFLEGILKRVAWDLVRSQDSEASSAPARSACEDWTCTSQLAVLTLNPKPQTLNPKPLNPWTLYTLNGSSDVAASGYQGFGFRLSL